MEINRVGFDAVSQTNTTKVNKSSKDFAFTLTSKIEESQLKERLDGLIKDIDAQGKKLSEHMDIKDLKKYKSLVSEFVNEVVTHSHKFSRDNFLDRRGHHRVYANVKVIDKNVDELAQQVLADEKDKLGILNKIDEIRGLLLDIMT